MTKIIALAAAAALSVGLGVTVSGAANADGVRPTAKEIKSALTGFTRTMVNSRGFPMTFYFKAGGVLQHENHRGRVAEGRWWVVGEGTPPKYDDKEVSLLKGKDPVFCYDFPRAGRGDIRRVCLDAEKVGDKIHVIRPTTGERSYTLDLKK